MNSVRARRFGVAALTMAALLSLAPTPAASQSRTYAMDAYPFPGAIALRQWRSVLARAPRLAERWSDIPCRDGAPALACAAAQVDRLEQRLQPLPPEQQVAGVYAFYNRFQYRHPRGRCGPDCWATPLEFIARRTGDCHDYVVAEYFTLRHLGFEERNLQLMIVKLKGYDDPFAGGHIVLRVQLPSRDVVLDNRKKTLTGSAGLKDYRLVAGLNAQSIEVFEGILAASTTAAPMPRRESQPNRLRPDSAERQSGAAPIDKSSTANSGACLQSATLADWTSNLPCARSASGFRIKSQTNSDM
jgi:hypothetical protein